MSDDVVIRVEGLGKAYSISHQRQKAKTRSNYRRFSEDLVSWASWPLRKVQSFFGNRDDLDNGSVEEFWALKDVSFEVRRGEAIGIIGRNGAGKSTLLKILSRITEPTTGRIEIDGKVASLLEVGTGFHPELSGRENIYLNGAILGMSRTEIKSKFDEIVAFAEVEKFLDTPVKRYSSGMYVRLAFAVAAHLDPEILVVDEVLAVGDAQFQKKCLGKMGDVAKRGRTVLFVSHNMGAITGLCETSILLNAGSVVAKERSDLVIGKYLSLGVSKQGEVVDDSCLKNGQKVKIKRLKFVNCSNAVCSEFDLREKIFLVIEFDVLTPGKGYNISFELYDLFGNCVFSTAAMDASPEEFLQKFWEPGRYRASIELPNNILRAGDYRVRASSTIPKVEVLDIFPHDLQLTTVDVCSPVVKTGEGRKGIVMPILPWTLARIE